MSVVRTDESYVHPTGRRTRLPVSDRAHHVLHDGQTAQHHGGTAHVSVARITQELGETRQTAVAHCGRQRSRADRVDSIHNQETTTGIFRIDERFAASTYQLMVVFCSFE